MHLGRTVLFRLSRLAHGLALVVIVFLMFMPSLVQASTLTHGSLTDPVGDARWGAADFTSLSVTVDSSGMVLVSGRFAPGTFHSDSMTCVSFDIDQNPATGFAGRDSNHSDPTSMGSECSLYIYAPGYEGYARTVNDSGGTWHWAPTHYAVNYLADGFDVSIPLSALGSSNGLMNFDGLAVQEIGIGECNPVGDYMPDLGQPVGRTSEPGDINKDGYTNVGDLQALVAAWGSDNSGGWGNWNLNADLNGDGHINVSDLQTLVANWGKSAN